MSTPDGAEQEHIVLASVEKSYGAALRTRALAPTSLAIARGEFVVIVGPSGSGKTTLLNLLGGLDHPDAGSVTVDGQDLTRLSGRQLTAYRRAQVGFVFQFFNLIPTLTARENIELTAELVGDRPATDRWIDAIGLAKLAGRFPAELSGGQQQRIAVARAMAKGPRILLADEPTGALDQEAGKQILKLMRDAGREQGLTVLLVTHNMALAAIADRVIHLRDGQVIRDERQSHPKQVEELAW